MRVPSAMTQRVFYVIVIVFWHFLLFRNLEHPRDGLDLLAHVDDERVERVGHLRTTTENNVKAKLATMSYYWLEGLQKLDLKCCNRPLCNFVNAKTLFLERSLMFQST